LYNRFFYAPPPPCQAILHYFFVFSKKILQKKQPDAVCRIVFVTYLKKNYAKCLFLSAFTQMYFSSKSKFSFLPCRNKIVQIKILHLVGANPKRCASRLHCCTYVDRRKVTCWGVKDIGESDSADIVDVKPKRCVSRLHRCTYVDRKRRQGV